MTYELTVDRDRCISAGRCLAASGGFFVLDETDELVAIDPAVARPDDELLVHLARGCPSGAIMVTGPDGESVT